MANNLKTRYFMNMSELQTFVNGGSSDVVTIVSIFYDTGSGKFCLCYTPT